jgi:hypothetical protein
MVTSAGEICSDAGAGNTGGVRGAEVVGSLARLVHAIAMTTAKQKIERRIGIDS